MKLVRDPHLTLIERAIPALFFFVFGIVFESVVSVDNVKQCRASLETCRTDLDAHDKFISLVVGDVERSIERTAGVLTTNGRACFRWEYEE